MGDATTQDNHSVAITGLSCRFPGDGDDLGNFWDSICEGKSAWSKIPKERFNVDAFWSPSKNRNTSITKGAHFLKEEVSKFDANFFSLPKKEVEAMDPQQRIMVEVVYEALEKAGLPLEKIAGTRTGVFMGHFTSDYKEMVYRDPENAPSYSITGACKTSLANRISWLFDLKGPSFALDTACSSSLVALHLACQSLRSGESDIAIVGGTSLLLNPEMFMYLSNQAFLSPDGKCKSFDESANGYGRGEGFGCVVLKRIDDAVSTGDPIRAVIRGTGSNQDGHTKGFTLPSADAQAALIKETYQRAGLDLKSTGYVEAHGTGTQAGDVQETEALARTLAASHSAENKLIVGSVKSNIGHLEAAAGIAGIVKAVLILENGVIPPSINFQKGNPKIKFDEWKIKIPTALTPWPTDGLRRISNASFGYGGTNAHAILDDAYSYLKRRSISGNHYTKVSHATHPVNDVPKINGFHEHQGPRLFVLSAADKEGLQRVKSPLSDYVKEKAVKLEQNSGDATIFMRELAYTLSERRSHLQWKTYGIASSPDELSEVLKDKESLAFVSQSSRSPRIGFVFTGQGAQWPRMGAELMEYQTFRASVSAADTYLREECECPWSAAEELQKGKSTSQLHLAAYSQTLCTVLQVALVDLLKTWDVSPKAVVGHSSGEIAAAYCMGALTKEDAWKIAYYRGILSSEMKDVAPELDGSMMAVGLSPEKAEEWISKISHGEVVVACVNSPSSVTLSGDTPGIDELLALLKEEGIFARKLQVDTAYHSPHMQMVAQDYYEALADIEPLQASGECTMHSSVTGALIEASQLGAVNWVKNLTSPVQFSSAIYDMLRPMKKSKRADNNAVDLLLEIGPHSALQGPATQTLKAHGIINIPYQSVITRNQSGVQTAMSLVGALFTQGVPVNISQVNNDGSTHITTPKPLVDLPKYPWKHSQRYWHESRIEAEYLSRETPKLSLLGAPSPSVGDRERLWRGFVRLSEEPWIADHKILGEVLYPGAGYLAMALESAYQTADKNKKIAAYKLKEVQFTSAAIISEGNDLECIVQLRPHIIGTRDSSSTWTEFVVTSSADGKTLRKNCSGLLIIEYEPAEGSDMKRERDLELQVSKNQYLEAKRSCTNALTPTEFYTDLASMGLIYGPSFANLTAINNRDGQSVCSVQIPDVQARTLEGSDRPHIIHPGTLDAIFHLAFAAIKGGKANVSSAMVPRFIDEVIISAKVPFKPGTNLPGFSNSAKHGFKELKADIVIFDENENLPIVEIAGFLCMEISGGSLGNAAETKPKAISSKLSWRPAIDLLSVEEQRIALEKSTNLNKLAEYLRLLHHSNAALSILEVDLESEHSSPTVLCPTLDGFKGILRTGEYIIACQDDARKSKFQEDPSLDPNITVEVLDIEKELSSEILKDQSYDVIVVSNLDAIAGKIAVIENMIKLLKEGGKICVVQANNEFEEVKRLLRNKGIKTMVFPGLEDSRLQQHGLIIGSQGGITQTSGGGIEVTIIEAAKPSKAAQIVATELAYVLEKLDYKTHRFTWGSDVTRLKNKSCISLVELDTSLLRDLTEPDFVSIKNLILDTANTFWAVGFDDPSAFMINGLARVVRNETPGMLFRTLHATKNSEHLGQLIGWAFHSKTADDEFLVQDGLLQVSRIEEDAALNQEINDLLPGTQLKILSIPLNQAQYPLKLCVQTPGMLDSLCFEADDLPETELEDEKIEIEVKATALNFREVMVAMGQISGAKLGLDASGIVRRVGASVTKFKVGDRVAMYGHGSHRTVHRSRADYCALIPDGLSFEQAATIPTVHGTAWNALVRLARVQKGQSILVHAAAGGVGQAAIQIAKHFEMEIFATVSSGAKRKLIRDEYGILDDHIFNSRDLSYVKGIKRMTKGRGVDVVLNSLSGEALRQTWHCIAPFGYFLEIGIKDILNNTGLDMKPFLQDATFSFFNLTHIENSRPDIMAAIIEGAFDFQRRGITRPISPLVTYPISEMESAFRLMQTGKHLGKIALTWSEEHVIPVIQRESNSPKINPDGAYILAGGLGGLGRSLSMKLVGLGARKLCFLSRSGSDSVQAKGLVRDLEGQQVQVRVYKCDIADEKAVATVVKRCQSDLGDIRGVFQCAMVLRDTLFMNMTYEQWIESTRPKVQGSWNLHQNLPNVDFFITLSSFSAIFGNRGQSNYAAAGAYEDALAHYRRAHGQHATTLDLGIMRDIGVLAETGITESLREWEKPYGIREIEFLALMERAIAGDITGTISPQVLTGLATAGSAFAAGITPPFYLDNARFSIMARTDIRGQTSATAGDSVSAQMLISQAKSFEEAADYVLTALVKHVAKMLQASASEIDTSRFLHSYGIDSLVAIEIVNWALKEIKSNITVFDVLAGVPMTTTANKIAEKSGALPKELVRV
ncbi:hypothetical protein G7Y89_g5307 [Cudoniella acicularis]|uniref:Carrier domain-containing protein n=1 Tax=Cudoniella acicularis TaxID=354080 RepID=A0A8H4W3H8_9HELO|nr:hypothetical protein G7Y89_g5307 [Cudoniella acicularis]